MQEVISHSRVDIKSPARLTLNADELPTIISEIVDPFYRRVVADHRTQGLISDDSFLFRLKIRQSVFLIRFFTQPLETLRPQMAHAGEVHGRINLDFGVFARYYLYYADLVLSWLARNRKADEVELARWQAKLFTLFGAMSCAFGGTPPEAVPQPAALPAQEVKKAVNLERLGDMHAPDALKISAQAFLAEMGGVDSGLVDELAELASEAQSVIDSEESGISIQLPDVLERLFAAYASILNGTYEFRDLGYALEALAVILKSAPVDSIPADRQRKLRVFLDAIVKDLEQWRMEIFVRKSALDIHYLDASLFSSCAQLETLLLPPKNMPQTDEEELELF
ncbi:MAG: protoglobin domain-containing protein [Campylobacterales bacterium]